MYTPKHENGISRLSSMEILERAPKPPNTGLTQIFYKCNNELCKAVGFPNLQGNCGDCYVRLVRSGQIKLPQPIRDQQQFDAPPYEDIEELKILNNENPPKRDLERRPNGQISAINFETKIKNGKPHENESKSTSRTVSFSTSRPTVGFDEIPIKHHKQQGPMRERNGDDVIRCSMSACENDVCSENENLCHSCFEVLKTHKSREHSPISKHQQIESHSGTCAEILSAAPCRGRDCDMYGSAETDGYCSQCLLTVLHEKDGQNTNVTPVEPRSYPCPRPEAPMHGSWNRGRPHFQVAEPSSMKPTQMLYQSHPQTSLHQSNTRRRDFTDLDPPTRSFTPSAPLSFYAPNPNMIQYNRPEYDEIYRETLIKHASNNPAATSSYDTLVSRVEQEAKRSTGKCRTEYCRNFGNSRCQGFCNGCFVSTFST